jgi:hypothetical protein
LQGKEGARLVAKRRDSFLDTDEELCASTFQTILGLQHLAINVSLNYETWPDHFRRTRPASSVIAPRIEISFGKSVPEILLSLNTLRDRLYGLVVRVPGYRSRGSGFDSRRYQIF